MEEIERQIMELQSNVTPEMQESFVPTLDEARQAMAAMRISETVAGDAREALELSMRLVEQAAEDQARATEHIRRAYELLGIEE